MKIESILRSPLQRWGESIVAKTAEWLPQNEAARGVRSTHFWIVSALVALCTLLYYADQTPLSNISLFNHSFFTTVHDLHRTLFLVPIVYAALVFRVRGSLIASSVFLGVVLPRAFLFSPYPNPLLRPLLFVFFATLISLLLAVQLNLVGKERKTRAELSKLHQELSEYRQRFEVRLMEQQEQLIRAEKLTSLGQMAASIAHEVNNPLSGVLVYTQLLAKKIATDSISKEVTLDYLSKMTAELTRSAKLIRSLLDFARQSPPTFREVNLNDVVNQAFELVSHSPELKHIQVLKELDSSLPQLMADFDHLLQVCTNLILNAIQAMPQGGKLALRTSIDNGQPKLEVQDTGCGISPENMHKLFTPFFTTKGEIKGVGLGLAVAYGIIERHQGRIEVQSKEGEGTTFTIYLPLFRKEEQEKG